MTRAPAANARIALWPDSGRDGGRRKLWDDPSGPLPDVYVSESSLYVAEGEATQYTVSLTAAPGMREDTTVRNKPHTCIAARCGETY